MSFKGPCKRGLRIVPELRRHIGYQHVSFNQPGACYGHAPSGDILHGRDVQERREPLRKSGSGQCRDAGEGGYRPVLSGGSMNGRDGRSNLGVSQRSQPADGWTARDSDGSGAGTRSTSASRSGIAGWASANCRATTERTRPANRRGGFMGSEGLRKV